MFKLVTPAKGWKVVTSSLGVVNDEAVVRIGRDGIECFTMDPSHTEAIGFFWGKENFSVYEAQFNDDGYCDLNISLKTFVASFKRFGSDDEVTLTDIGNSMLVTNGKKKLVNSLIASSAESGKNAPKIEYQNKVAMKIAKIEEVMDDFKVFGIEELRFKSEDGNLVYHGDNESGQVKGIMIEDNTMECNETGFNFTFMEPVLKAIKPFAEPEMTMELLEGKPIRLTFTVTDMMIIQYYLAPLVDN